MANWETQAASREYQMDENGELTVVERLASLLETGQYTDVTIRVGQGNSTTTFKAHRLLLATASKPLNKLISSHIENGAPLQISDIEPDAFQNILRYIYTDNLHLSSISEAFALLRMSKQWSLTNLVNKTFKYLEGFLELYEPSSEEKKNELCELLMLTEPDANEVNKKCWEILLRDVNKIVPCQGFLDMSEDVVRKLLKHEAFIFHNQLTLFEAIRDWGMNQIVTKNLSVNQLQSIISGFLEHVNFKAIKDMDFIDTILPSDCLGRGDLIAFFLSRGLEIPRDLAFNNNKADSILTKDGSKMAYGKTCRFKRGYKLPTSEIYQEHEVRFRVDNSVKLLGVGFGFLFSNTDMGITVHCQGPWETRQWSDITQTYCRVSYEKMKTADVRLMFNEPVNIEANQSYKILVRVGRMSSGSSDVDLWGGSQGLSCAKMNDAEFTFLKSAVDPNRKPEENEIDNKPGMITDLFYQLINDEDDKPIQSLSSPIPRKSLSPIEPGPPPPLAVHRSQKTSRPVSPKKLANDIIETFSVDSNPEPKTIFQESTPAKRKPIHYHKTTSDSSFGENEPSTPIWQRKDSSSSLYTRPFTLSRAPDKLPAFLNKSRFTSDKNKPTWEIPSRFRSDSISSRIKSRESSVTKERDTLQSNKYGVSESTTKEGYLRNGPSVLSNIKSRYTSNLSTPTTLRQHGYGQTSSRNENESNVGSRYNSRTSYDTTSRYNSSTISTPNSSVREKRYGENPSSNYLTSRYGSSTLTSSPKESTTSSESRFNQSDLSAKSRYSGTESSRYNNDSSRFKSSDSSTYGTRDSTASRFGTGSTLSSSSRFTTPELMRTPRYAGGASSFTSRFGTGDSSSRYNSLTSPTSPREPTPSRSSYAGGRYSTSTATNSSNNFGSKYNSSTSRFGSSLYRR